MRFDDSLDTVLAAESSTASGLEATWRQVVDLIGRGRAAPRSGAIERLRAIRGDVSATVRAASARGLERARPPVELVALFVDDELAVAAPVARSARLAADEWIALLPAMRPATRGVLRHRRDLDGAVERALAAFGPVDFALAAAPDPEVPVADPPEHAPVSVVAEPAGPALEPSTFVAFAQAVRDLPILADAVHAPPPAAPPADDPFEIAQIVARIEAHQRAVEDRPVLPELTGQSAAVDRFRFETDASGLIRWVEGVERSAIVGLSLTAGRDGAPAHTDGIAAGALARRGRFADAQLVIDGGSPAAGTWRISGVPAFDADSGRFTGYRGTARRPRPDEQPRLTAPSTAPDALRQLVHELRTPTNAISGFAEMIEREVLGAVPPHYRAQAATIRTQTDRLLGAIDDLDTAARIEAGSLSLHAETVALTPLLSRVLSDLTPLADLRGARLTLEVAGDVQANGDARALERLFSRLLTALVASTARGEVIAGRVDRDAQAVTFEIARPAAFAAPTQAARDVPLFSADAEVEAVADGEPLLGGGFAFRLALRLVTELGGTLVVGAERLTLRLPAAVERMVEQATV